MQYVYVMHCICVESSHNKWYVIQTCCAGGSQCIVCMLTTNQSQPPVHIMNLHFCIHNDLTFKYLVFNLHVHARLVVLNIKLHVSYGKMCKPGFIMSSGSPSYKVAATGTTPSHIIMQLRQRYECNTLLE